jgi:hypothetical protein
MGAYRWTRSLALLSLLSVPAASAGELLHTVFDPQVHTVSDTLAERVRQANDRFKNVLVALSEATGRLPARAAPAR